MSNLNPNSKKKYPSLTNPVVIAALLAASFGLIGVLVNGGITYLGNLTQSKVSTQAKQSEAERKLQSIILADRRSGVKMLEEIIKEVPDKQWSILIILENFIKEKSPASKKSDYGKKIRYKMPDDVKDALSAIKNRNTEYDYRLREPTEKRRILDLSKINLFGADLEDAQLPEVNLRYSDVTDTVLKRANLKKAFLERINLKGSGLENADLSGANLEKADLSGTTFDDATLDGANLRGAILTDSNITDEQIKKTCNWEQAISKNRRLEDLDEDNTGESKSQKDCKKFPIFKEERLKKK
jgi:Pentapeptide repeats (8 copies)